MATQHLQPELPAQVRQVLDAVRRRIRAYVWAEGLALLVVLLGGAFWLGLLGDWLFEPSAEVRQIALAAVGIAGLHVGYRYLLRRAFVPVSDTTAAVLLERRFPELQDHLLTAVDVSAPSHAASYHPDLVARTWRSANEAVAEVHAGDVFNRRPLVRAVGAAVGLALSIVLFALLSRDVFGFWLERIALSDQPWPRRVYLEVVGFPTDSEGRRIHKLAQDDDYELLVHASAAGYQVPEEVEIRFRLADGRRGRDTMIRVGDAKASGEDHQVFRYEFKRVAGDMEFDVVGGDDRVRDLQLAVVQRPELLALELECVYPDYLRRPPRRLPVTGGMRIPEGTRLALYAGATKPLTAARIHTANQQQDALLEFPRLGAGLPTSPPARPEVSESAGSGDPRTTLRWEYGTLSDDDVLLVSVTDTDGVASREPYRVSLAVVRDELPQVAVRLASISSAITPEAVLPLVGKIADDYGLERVWFEYQVDGGAVETRPFARQPDGEPLIDQLDRFDTRAADPATGQRVIDLRPGQRFSLWLKASDRFDLSDEPRAGSSQQFALDVVTPADLLALMERRELALRQRYEAIYEKVTDTRNLLSRVEFDDQNAERVGEGENGRGGDDDGLRAPLSPVPPLPLSPSDPGPSRLDGPTSVQRALARRRLRVAGSLQNIVQAADEVGGVAEGFDDLGDELTNNRIDNPDLRSRLREQIAQPLHRIADERMPQLAAQLQLVEQHVADPTAGQPELDKAIALADEVLVAMKQVLDRMLELETYHEVVALLRGIITDQEEIGRRTKEQQRERLRGLFEKE